jgi:hypothetical protein
MMVDGHSNSSHCDIVRTIADNGRMDTMYILVYGGHGDKLTTLCLNVAYRYEAARFRLQEQHDFTH